MILTWLTDAEGEADKRGGNRGFGGWLNAYGWGNPAEAFTCRGAARRLTAVLEVRAEEPVGGVGVASAAPLGGCYAFFAAATQ